jgi:hypothetical protein
MMDALATTLRFTTGLQHFLGSTLSAEECRQMVRDRLRRRQESFLYVVDHAVLRNPKSPYLPLFRQAGVSYDDLARWVEGDGVEGALSRLFDAGVSVALDEFKGRAPIRRAGLELPLHARDFDNPLATRHFDLQTGGSRGRRTVLLIDFEYITHEAADDRQYLESFGLLDRPVAIWRPVPPGTAGIKGVLRRAKLGLPVDRWFSQTRLSRAPKDVGYAGITYLTTLTGRMRGGSLPFPTFVPLPEARRVAVWLAEQVAAGTPALLDTIGSSGVRAARVALEEGLNIAGTFFRLGGEPLTAAKAAWIREAGGRAVCHYAFSELGRLGLACASPEAIDDVHLLTDKIALLQRPRSTSGAELPAFYLTSLHPSSPKIAINVESGDYGVLVERDCPCPLTALGFRQHVHTIRSYEKLTTEGMHFLGTDLLRLLEETLPARFGGGATDYQLVEEEEDGMTKLNLVVSPRVGPIEDSRLVASVLETLGGTAPGARMMEEVWRSAKTLRVVRQEPFTTGAAKIQTLHIVRKRGAP